MFGMPLNRFGPQIQAAVQKLQGGAQPSTQSSVQTMPLGKAPQFDMRQISNRGINGGGMGSPSFGGGMSEIGGSGFSKIPGNMNSPAMPFNNSGGFAGGGFGSPSPNMWQMLIQRIMQGQRNQVGNLGPTMPSGNMSNLGPIGFGMGQMGRIGG